VRRSGHVAPDVKTFPEPRYSVHHIGIALHMRCIVLHCAGLRAESQESFIIHRQQSTQHSLRGGAHGLMHGEDWEEANKTKGACFA
jgi:hypothetical protein